MNNQFLVFCGKLTDPSKNMNMHDSQPHQPHQKTMYSIKPYDSAALLETRADAQRILFDGATIVSKTYPKSKISEEMHDRVLKKWIHNRKQHNNHPAYPTKHGVDIGVGSEMSKRDWEIVCYNLAFNAQAIVDHYDKSPFYRLKDCSTERHRSVFDFATDWLECKIIAVDNLRMVIDSARKNVSHDKTVYYRHIELVMKTIFTSIFMPSSFDVFPTDSIYTDEFVDGAIIPAIPAIRPAKKSVAEASTQTDPACVVVFEDSSSPTTIAIPESSTPEAATEHAVKSKNNRKRKLADPCIRDGAVVGIILGSRTRSPKSRS
jgi:hypothetical protein